MKKKILFGFLVLIILASSINYTYAWEEVIDADAGFNIETGGTQWEVRTFYSNYTRRFYAFYNYDRKIGGWDNCFSTSVDGITWTEPTYSPMGGVAAYEKMYGGWLDIYLEPNGRYFHYARIDLDPTPNAIYYGKIELFLNGTMDFFNGTTEQTAIAVKIGVHEVLNSVSVVADNESRPYISAEFTTGVTDEAYLLTCDQTNGSWLSHTIEGFQSVFANVNDEQFFTDLVPTGDGVSENGVGRGVHWIVYYDQTVGFDIKMRHSTGVDYKDGNGWNWNSPDAINDGEGQWTYQTWDDAYSGNSTILFKQTEDLAAPDRITLSYMVREGKNAWENKTQVAWTELGDARDDFRFTPNCAMDENKDAVFTWTVTIPVGNKTWWYRLGNINNNSWQSDIVEWNQSPVIQDQIVSQVTDDQGFVPFNVPASLLVADLNDDNIYHDYLFTEFGGSLVIPAIHLNTTLYNQDGTLNDEWIFEGEVYDLVSYIQNATNFFVNFTDSRHQIRFQWNNETNEQWISVDPADQFTIGLPWTNYTRYEDNITRLQWRFIPDRSIIDCQNESWGYYIENSEMDYNLTGILGFESSVYNLGGFTYYNFQGDGGRTTGGHPWELYATNGTEGSSARAEQIYRKLQHIHLLIEIDMDNEWDAGAGEFDIDPGVGFVDIGIDYRLEGAWVEGFYVRLYVQSAEVGHDNAGTDEDYVEWSVDWYNYDPGTGTQQNLRSGLIYSNHWGYDNENLDPDYHNRTSSQLWVDLWFDRTNASTAIAGQVNAMYYGMKEHGASWWFGYGAFQPMRGDYENAMFLDDLYDEGGNVTDSMKFDLMRVFVEVGKVADADGDDETWLIRAIENVNRKLADDRMQGIEQPSFEETLVLEMPMFQSLNPLIRAIDGISVAIWKGALGFQKILWGAMDSFFAWAGFGEGFFSTITAFLMAIPELFVKMMENLPIMIQNMVQLVEDIFGMVVRILPTFVIGIGYLTESVMNYWTTLTAFFTGGLFPINIIQEIQLGDWIRAGFALIPAWEMFSIIWADDSGKKLKERIDFYSGIFNGVLNFIKGAIGFMQSFIQTIMDILPG